MNILSKRWNNCIVLEIQGRIDGISAPELKGLFDQHAASGDRIIILDFSDVSYMSSAGLRVLVQGRKSLKPIGGELILVAIPELVREVFRVSGMDHFLTILPDYQAVQRSIQTDAMDQAGVITEHDGSQYEWKKLSDSHGHYFIIGSTENLSRAAYQQCDNRVVKPSQIHFGFGLAALGDAYNDFKSLYGETVIIGHHFFSYPAVERSRVDFSFFQPGADHSFNFLYGLGIQGSFSGVLRFDSSQEPVDLGKLAEVAGMMTEAPLFAVVILAKSGGVQWMHLKKAPISENNPEKESIFDAGHFHRWMNFTPETDDFNKTMIACGVVVKNIRNVPSDMKHLFPGDGNMHLHAAICENGLWSNDIRNFEVELMRIVTDFNIQKVVHLLPASRLVNGYIGIIDLEKN